MITIISPVYNEESLVLDSYRSIKKEIEKLTADFEIIFANDGSTDNSKKVMEYISSIDNKFSYISWDINKGMGFAHRRLYNAAKGDVIIQADIDLSISPEIFSRMLGELKSYDVVIASRYQGIRANLPLKRKIASRIYYCFVRLLFGINVKDICSGFIAFRRLPVKSVHLRSYKFEIHVELLYKLVKKGYRIKEIPADFNHDERHSKFNGFKDSITTLVSTLILWKDMVLMG